MDTSPTYSDLLIEPNSQVKYRLSLPAPDKPKQLLILLHGVGSNETHVQQLAQGAPPNTLVILCQGPLQLGAEQFAWFRVKFTPEGPKIDEQETVKARLLLTAFVSHIQKQFKLLANKTIVAGFSQGGIMSASLALCSPECIKGFAILSGRILPELSAHMASEPQLKHLQAFIGHGQFDQILEPLWAEKSHALLEKLHIFHTYRTYTIAHEVSPAMRDDFIHWLLECFNQGLSKATPTKERPQTKASCALGLRSSKPLATK